MKSLLITGDSLSYNRYDYINTATPNAADCPVGMDSWSFRIRKSFISSASGFLYGDQLNIKEPFTHGIGEGIDPTHAFFGDRVVTISPQNDAINLEVESKTGRIVIYLQHRLDNYCRFDVYVDGKLRKKAVDTFGRVENFCGFDIITLELECDAAKDLHDIVFCNFEHTEKFPLVTIAGASVEPRFAAISGQGSRTIKFLLYHFKERIAKYSPDMLILILGGNDLIFYSEKEYKFYLETFFKQVLTCFPNCKIATITIPPSAKCLEEIRGVKINSDDDINRLVDKYNAVLEEVSKKNNAICIRQKDIFNKIDPSIWRFDNVHLSKKGNDMLYQAVCEKIKF